MPLMPDRMQVIREYLVQECLDKVITCEEDRKLCDDFKLKMPAYHPNVPKQTNGTDCGLFLLENVECFLERPDFVMQDLNQKKGELFKKRCVDEKREHLKRVIIAMVEKRVDTTENFGKRYGEFRKDESGKMFHVARSSTPR